MTREARLRWALVLNAGIVVGQVIAGFAAHSLGLLADAGHNLADVGAIILSLAAIRWAKRAPDQARSFGYHRSTILAAQANAAVVIAVAMLIGFQAVERLGHARPVTGPLVVAAAVAALVVNLICAGVVAERDGDVNMRSVLLHMAGDAAGSGMVAIAGAAIAFDRGASWLDPAASIVIGVLITVQAVRLIKQTTDVLLEGTPIGLDVAELASGIREVPGVEDVHDLHVWGLTDELRVLSAHIILDGHPTLEEAQAVGVAVKRAISGRFLIAHATLELECEGCVDDGSWCAMTAELDLHGRGHHH